MDRTLVATLRSSPLPRLSALALAFALTATSGCARRVVPEAQQTQSDAAMPDAKMTPPAPTAKPPRDDEGGAKLSKNAAPLFQKTEAKDRFVLAWTGSVEGYVAPCGCTGDPLGGVARLSAALDLARGAYGDRVLFLDAGNLFFETGAEPLAADACQTDARIDLLLETYARQGLAATTWGRHDDVRGPKWRDERLMAAKVPTVLTAGEAADPKRPFVRQVVRTVGEMRVGVVAARLAADANATAVESAAKSLSQAAKELVEKEKAVVVVALLQAQRPVAKRLLAKTNGVAVALLGEKPGELPSSPERVGEALLLSSGQQAQYLGVAEFVVDDLAPGAKIPLDDRQGKRERRLRLLNERIAQYAQQVSEMDEGPRKDFVTTRLEQAKEEQKELETSGNGPEPKGPFVSVRSIPLPRGFPEEKPAKVALDTYEASIPALTAKCEANITCPEVPEGTATYVGVETCFQCHRGAVQFWQQQKVEGAGKDKDGNVVARTLSHATAWDTLVDEGKDTDRTCVGCHSIGFNKPGGYCKTSEVDFRTDVQCEACHGPASKHVAAAGDPNLISRGVPESTCRECHHVPHIETTESFVYDDKLLLILGEGHGLKKRQEIEARTKAATP